MKHTSTLFTATPILLHEEHSQCADIALTYRLFALPSKSTTHFLIAANTAEDEAQVALGVPLPLALSYFQTITEGKVMPCTLCDVLEDLRYLENF